MSERGYCETCGAGYGEYMACEEVNCQWKQEQEMNDSGKPIVNIADVIGKVRKVEAQIAEKEAEFEESIKSLKEMSEAGRAYLLVYLNKTGSTGTVTPQGGCNRKTKVTFSVEDRELFKKFIIENEQWEMIAWRANDAICEDYVTAYKEAPPGSKRTAKDFLTITAPKKKRLRKTRPGSLTEEEWDQLEKEVDAELDAQERNNGDAQ